MDALVFAAGRGTRLRPYTDTTPKPLLDVGGQPILTRCLRAITAAGVDRIVLVVGYRGEAIVEHIGDSFRGVPVVYAHQDDRKGLAHAVLTAAEALEREGFDGETGTENDVLTVNGDNVFDCDLSPLLERHRESDADGTVLLDRVSRNEAETAALCDLESDGTIRTLESTRDPDSSTRESADSAVSGTPTPGYLAAGVQTHSADLFEACRAVDRGESGEYELADALQLLVDRGRRYVGVELEGWHLNINTPADLTAARAHFADESETG